MHKCFVNLAGGLGNQLFQLAAGHSYCKRNGHELVADAANWSAHQGCTPLKYKNTIYQNIPFCTSVSKGIEISERSFFSYQETDVVLRGYFQDLVFIEPYVDDFIRTVLGDFCPFVSVDNKYVGVHWREGDFNAFPDVHKVCSDEYYVRALDLFGPAAIGSVCSDTRRDFPSRFEPLLPNNEVEDLAFLSLHKNFIGSNSSFSWWAARMGVQKRAVFPNMWLANPPTSFKLVGQDPVYNQWTLLAI